jgi:hypothetical protein
MKKSIIVILSIITLVLTFIFAEILSIYHFGRVPTLLTTLYLISIFSIFEYLSISLTYVIRKIIKKEKLGIKKIMGLILLFIALLLVLLFFIVVDVDYLNWYAYSSPFYLNVIFRSIEFLVPVIILIITSVLFIKNKK